MTEVIEQPAHAKLSASGSSMWLNCTASVRMNEGKADTSSIFAAEGTVAHALGEYCLKNDIMDVFFMVGKDMLKYDKDLGKQIEGVDVPTVVTEEMADYIQVYVDYVRSYAEGAEVVMIERRVDFSNWVPAGFGTADAIILAGTHLHVIDLKYGKGVAVSAFENTQGMLYGLGSISTLVDRTIEDITIHIVQPRLDNISEYHRSKKQIIRWANNTVRPKAEEALSDNAPFTPGEKQCLWCKAKGDCTAYAKFSLEKSMEGFDFKIDPKMELKDDGKLKPADYSTLLPFTKAIKNWCDAVEERAMELLGEGTKIEGFKLVEGRSNRRWVDDNKAQKTLSEKLDDDELFTRKMISPTQAEKLLGKHDPLLKDLIDKPEGKPSLTHESDKRPALADASEGFEFETTEG